MHSSSSGGGTPRRVRQSGIKKKSIFEAAATKIKSDVVKWTSENVELPIEEDSDERRGRMVGPLTEEERLKRVQRYLNKKHRKNHMKKYSYVCRKQVAEKRLRIKGRFVTKE